MFRSHALDLITCIDYVLDIIYQLIHESFTRITHKEFIFFGTVPTMYMYIEKKMLDSCPISLN